MKTKKTALVSALTALALLLAAVSGFPECGKREEKAPEPPAGDESLVKTGIFTAQDLPMPDGMSFNERIVPFWDPEERTLTFCASETISVDFEDGTFSESEVLYLVTSDAEEVRSKVPLPDMNGEFPTAGTIGEKEAVLVLGTDDRSYRILLYDRESGESSASGVVNALFPHRVLGIAGALLDRDENGEERIAVLSQEEAVFFDRRWTVKSAAPLPSGMTGTSLFRTPSGTILAGIYDGGGESGCAVYDRKAASFGEPLSGVWDPVPCAAGFDYCSSGEAGVYGYSLSGGEPVLLLNSLNSDLRGSGQLWFAADADTLLYSGSDAVYSGPFRPGPIEHKPVLCLHGEDVDISDAAILHLAYANCGLTGAVLSAVADFNRTRADCQIVLDDYSDPSFATDGSQRLAMDMVTGVFQPDILIGDTYAPYLTAAAEKGLYTDLSPYLEKDPLVNRDNLFGSVLRLFDDGSGGIWGLAPFVSVRAELSTPDNLGPFAEKGYWTMAEMIDYIESLPDGTVFAEGFTQSSMVNYLCRADACLAYIDGDRCSFDSPEFVRSLNFLASLPDEEELRKTSPIAGLDESQLTEAYRDGRIRTVSGFFGSIIDFSRLELKFGRKDWVPIGSPVSEQRAGAGIGVSAGHMFLIASTCSLPDAAWDLCRMFFTDKEGQAGLPALRSMLDSMAEDYLGREYIWFYGRGGKWSMGEGTITAEDRMQPNVSGVFSEEDLGKMKDILDSSGTPLIRTLRIGEIQSILREELSAFLGGVGSAEDCAGKIQSRVSIWLSENR
jgi:ABC-type glycerol-3-phosphate transport system substrate-binding protein